MNIVIATVKSWNIRNAEKLIEDCPGWNVSLITDKYKLAAQLEASNPDFVFFPHWSWKIPPSIYENYNCVVFHMTDLPFGRGGSPLQNLIGISLANVHRLFKVYRSLVYARCHLYCGDHRLIYPPDY